MLTWVLQKEIINSPPKWAKKVLSALPKEFSPMLIKISKNNIETIDIRLQKTKERFSIIFPTGETLP